MTLKQSLTILVKVIGMWVAIYCINPNCNGETSLGQKATLVLLVGVAAAATTPHEIK